MCYSRRIRDKYEAEISELERSEKITKDKYNQNKVSVGLVLLRLVYVTSLCVVFVKGLLLEAEGENERKKVTLQQKEKEIKELNRVKYFELVCWKVY